MSRRGDAGALRYRDRQLRVTLTHGEERYVVEGEQVSLVIRGEERTLERGQPLVPRP